MRGNRKDLDAFLFSAEAGSAWTLVYPQFTVAIPKPDLLSIPVAYASSYGDQPFMDFLNTWLLLKNKDGTIQRLYSYWIEGKTEERKTPVWSLIDYLSGDTGEEDEPEG
jgi:hypothetical protein